MFFRISKKLSQLVTSQSVQRLFSIFPTGSAGIALMVLRSIVALTIVMDASQHWSLASEWMIDGLVALIALGLLLGFLTPYCGTLASLIELILLVVSGAASRFPLAMSALTAVTVAVLGPGAYSLDGR